MTVGEIYMWLCGFREDVLVWVHDHQTSKIGINQSPLGMIPAPVVKHRWTGIRVNIEIVINDPLDQVAEASARPVLDTTAVSNAPAKMRRITYRLC